MSATFWVTTNCNLNCKYCYEGENKINKIMTKDIVDKSIEFIINKYFNDKEKLIISLHGGEPLLEFNIIKYIVHEFKKKLKTKDVRFTITTNGTILNEEILEFIISEIPDITFSIDGTSKTQNKMRPFLDGRGSHNMVIKNAKVLNSRLSNMRIRMTFDSSTVSNLYNDVKFLVNEGFKCIVPAPNLFDKRWNDNHMKILEKQIIQIKEYIKYKENVVVSIIEKPNYIRKSPCTGGINSIHIYPDGMLYPCILSAGDKRFCIGNIVSGIDKKNNNRLLSYSQEINTECLGCSLYNYCNATRCKIINKLITDNYNKAPEMHCALENLIYKVNAL